MAVRIRIDMFFCSYWNSREPFAQTGARALTGATEVDHQRAMNDWGSFTLIRGELFGGVYWVTKGWIFMWLTARGVLVKSNSSW